MTIVGRLTADAEVKALKEERKVVNFSVAVNDSYKKNGERIKLTTFYNCRYWISAAIADKLKKGTLVELNGRIYVNAYTDMNGNAKASLNCHVSNIKLHGWPKETAAMQQPAGQNNSNEPHEETPF